MAAAATTVMRTHYPVPFHTSKNESLVMARFRTLNKMMRTARRRADAISAASAVPGAMPSAASPPAPPPRRPHHFVRHGALRLVPQAHHAHQPAHASPSTAAAVQPAPRAAPSDQSPPRSPRPTGPAGSGLLAHHGAATTTAATAPPPPGALSPSLSPSLPLSLSSQAPTGGPRHPGQQT